MPHQANCFGRDMILNLALVVDWQVITDKKHQQLEIDNFGENARQVPHDYAVGNLVYVEMTSAYRKLDDKKQGMYIKQNYLQTVQFESKGYERMHDSL